MGGRQRREHSDDAAVRITSAARSHSDEVGARQRRYVISMSIRTVCFVLAVVLRGEPVLMWILIAASFFLPYFAVIVANAGAPTDPDPTEYVDPDASRPSLGPGTQE